MEYKSYFKNKFALAPFFIFIYFDKKEDDDDYGNNKL